MPTYTPGKSKAIPVLPSKDPDSVSVPYYVVLYGNLPGDTTSPAATFLPSGTTITSGDFVITGDSTLTLLTKTVSTTYAVGYFSGGTAGKTATITFRFVSNLSNGAGGYYSDDVSFKLPIRNQ